MHMNTIKAICALGLSGALLVLNGCASTDPENVERDYGNSVRSMIAAQTANPSAPVDNNAIDHGDGVRINAAIEANRKSVADPKEVMQDQGMDFGTGSTSSGN
jgi:type IV pilus biogenesis protein CpaD/CtpE